MALTQISTQGIKDGTISSTDLADQSVTLAKLPHGTSSNDGKFLRANNGADPTFETVSSIGGGTGVDFDDNVKVRFGTGNDLEIFHNGTHSVIQNNTGTLFTLADNLIFKNNANNETLITATANGSVELYHDNSKKLETNSEGVKISGFLEMEDNQRIQMGTGDDLQIYHDGSDSYLKDAGTGHLNITSSQVNIINAAVNESMAKFIQDGGVELYFNGNKKLATTSNGIKLDDDTRIGLGNSEDLQIFHNGSHSFIKNSGTGVLHIQGNNSNDLKISPRDDEDSIVLKNNGAVELYHDNSKKLETTSQGANLEGNGSDHYILDLHNTGSGKGSQIQFRNDHDASANIGITGDTTGDLRVYTEKTFKVQHGSEIGIKSIINGAVELYHNGSKKFETESSGCKIDGSLELTANLVMSDNDKIRIGNSQDLEIFHNGSESFIKNNTATLRILADSFQVDNNANSEILINAVANGAVELYHDGSKKFETKSDGATMFGSLYFPDATVATGRAKFGAGDDLQIYHDGSDSIIDEIGAGGLHIKASAIRLRGVNSVDLSSHDNNENMLRAFPNGAVELYHNNNKKFETTSGGISVSGDISVNTIKNTSGGSSSTPEQIEQGRLKAYVKINAVSGTFVRQSFGVSSVTDSGTGNYTVNFSTAFANDEYIYCLGSTNTNHSRGGVALQEGKSTTTCDLFGTSMGNNGRFDVEVHCGFYGD